MTESSGQESIDFTALKLLLEKRQQKPLDQPETEMLDGVEWTVLHAGLPYAQQERPADVPGTAPVLVLATIYYRPLGTVDDQDEMAEGRIVGLAF
jgi:hypothetical protein